jgi:hypothetical protein
MANRGRTGGVSAEILEMPRFIKYKLATFFVSHHSLLRFGGIAVVGPR